MLTDKAVRIDSDFFLKNGAIINPDVQVGANVTAKVTGERLITISVIPTVPSVKLPVQNASASQPVTSAPGTVKQAATPVVKQAIPAVVPPLRDGHGIIKGINPGKPYLSYTYSWKDKATGEVKSAVQEFYAFIGDLKDKLATLNVGDKILVKFSGSGYSAVCYDIAPDPGKSYGGKGGSQKTPDEQYRIVLQSSMAQVREALSDYLTLKCLPFDGDFHEYMEIIRKEALITGDLIFKEGKKAL